MKILVTGGAGFIGSALVRVLVEKKYDVRCLVKNDSDVSFLKKLDVELIYGDIRNKEDLRKAVNGVDVVYHLAGLLGRDRGSRDDFYDINIEATKNLLNLCKKQKFIFCSSCGVYGRPVKDANESTPLNPLNLYEITKEGAEKLVSRYNNYVIIRPALVYGPRDRFFLRFFKFANKFKIFPVVGSTYLHLIYVDDLIDVFIKCLNKNNEIYVVADSRPITMLQFARLSSKAIGKKILVINLPHFFAKLGIKLFGSVRLIRSICDFFLYSKTYDNTKIRLDLNVNPVEPEEGLRKTVDWYKQNGWL